MMDASAFRTGAQLLGSGKLYDPVVAGQLQFDETGEKTTRVYLRPPWYALLTKWLSIPPLPIAMAIWKGLILAAGGIFALLWRQPWWALASLCWSFPFVAAIEQGQDTPFLLLGVVISLKLAAARSDVLAGFALALCTVKPHFLILVIVAFLIFKRWKIIGSFVAGIMILAAISFLAEDRDWPSAYGRQLLQPTWYNSVTASPNIVGLFPLYSQQVKAVISTFAVILCIPVVAWIGKRKNLEFTVWSALTLGVLSSFHAYLQDVLLSVPLALTALEAGQPKAFRWAIFSLSPLASFALAAWIPLLGPLVQVASLLGLLQAATTAESGSPAVAKSFPIASASP